VYRSHLAQENNLLLLLYFSPCPSDRLDLINCFGDVWVGSREHFRIVSG
jgi:hypothetical protein